MSLMEFRNSTITKNIDAIIHNDELTTMEKLKEIVGDNYFTNSNRAKGIYQLIQENNHEISGNHYLTSVIANAIKENCLEDFKKIANNGDISILPNAIQDMIKPEKMNVLDLIGEENAKKFFAREIQNPYFLSKEVEFSKEAIAYPADYIMNTNFPFDSCDVQVKYKFSHWSIKDTGLEIVSIMDTTNTKNNVVGMSIQIADEHTTSKTLSKSLNYAHSLAKTIDFSKISKDYLKEIEMDEFGCFSQADINRVVSKIIPDSKKDEWIQHLCDISSACNCVIYNAYSDFIAKNTFDRLYMVVQMYDGGQYEPTQEYPVFATMDKNLAEEYIKQHSHETHNYAYMDDELTIKELLIANSRDVLLFPFSVVQNFDTKMRQDETAVGTHNNQLNVDTDDIDL